jgi:hypothetical protein
VTSHGILQDRFESFNRLRHQQSDHTCSIGGISSVPGQWLTNPGFGHSATLLANGKVLIAGGSGEYSKYLVGTRLGQDTWRGAELYDPSTGTFVPTGKMVVPRMSHAAVALPDGRVLIAGGMGAWDSTIPDVPILDSAEIYDPQTDSFSATGSMTSAERCLKGILLGNGKVLIVGGPAALTDPPNAAPAQLYDPIAGTFAASRGNHTDTTRTSTYYGACPSSATLLTDGTVLISWNQGNVEIYDPVADAFRVARQYYTGISTTATLLTNGSVLFAGGNGPLDDDGQFGSTSAEIYDPGSSTFAPAATMKVARYDHTATLLPDGKVLLAGTNRSGVNVTTGLSSAELYDPGQGNFLIISPMITARFAHTATLLADGSVLIVGGLGVSDDATAERYYPGL